jgi:putative ABC transport system permease protein
VKASWDVHLSPEAEQALREISRTAAARVATVLDDLSRLGPEAVEADWHDDEWTGQVVAGDYVVMVAGRRHERTIVVVRIESLEVLHAHRVVDAFPLRLTVRRNLIARLRGLDLDVRYTLRVLRRTPLFVFVVVATLAVGLGGATALLDVVHTVYRDALPFGDGNRLVRIRNVSLTQSGEVRRYNVTPSDFHLLREQNRVFTEVIAQGGRSLALMGDGPAERVSAIGVSANWAETLRIRPVVGRVFTPDEERVGRDASVALISHSLWQRRFGGDSAIVGRDLRYDGGVLTVVGVMPPHLNYPYDADVWTPWTFPVTDATTSSLNVVARLADGVSVASAQLDADRVHADRQAAQLHGAATGFDVATVRDDFIRDEALILQALTAAVLFLLVLACINVANLFVARFATRRRELGIRAALGGRRDQQLRQMLLESMGLFVMGGIGGVGLSVWLRKLLAIMVPDELRTQVGLAGGMGAEIAAAGLGIGVLFGVVVGGAAAWRAVRTDVVSLVKQSGRSTIGRGDRALFDSLVVSQLALSLVLLVGAGLLIGHFRELSASHPGYDLTGVSTMRITIEQDRYQDPESRHQLVRSLEDRLGAAPGVERVGITTVNPLCCGNWGAPIEIEGHLVGPDDAPTLVAHSYVTPGYFEAMSIPILEGQAFERTDRPGGVLTVIVDEELARMAWPNEDPLGRRIRIARPNQPWRTVVGVVPVTDHEADMRASWFLPYYQDPTGASTSQLHIMVTGSAVRDMEPLRQLIAQIDPALAVYGVTTMDVLQRERISQDRLGAVVSAIFATFGLMLAGFSLYGLLSYSVELRSAEIGMRIVLGATRHTILRLVMRQAVARLVAGIVLGVGVALVLNHVLRSLVAGLGWVSGFTLLTLASLLAVIAAAAAAVPALRAARLDPIRCLRT